MLLENNEISWLITMYKNKCMIREQTENTNDNQINQVNISKTIYKQCHKMLS